jgi:hypothetical protein
MLICVFICSPILEIVECAGQSKATTIKKKEGQIVVGKLDGLIVLKDKLEESKLDAKTEYTVSYWLIRGWEADNIDEEGVHISKEYKGVQSLVIASSVNKTPNDVEVIKKVVDKDESRGGLFVHMELSNEGFAVDIPYPTQNEEDITKNNVALWAMAKYKKRGETIFKKAYDQHQLLLKESKPVDKTTYLLKGELLGVFREDQIVPTLEIVTEKGAVTIPVNQIVRKLKSPTTQKK